MLQQILQELWVDPELLEQLDDDQKQQLFCRMREEQVRRWRAWDDEQTKLETARKTLPPPPAFNNGGGKQRRQVQFRLGADGEPWVWVMGEHPDDKSIELILEEEARQKALSQAKREAEELRKKLEAELLLSEEEEAWRQAQLKPRSESLSIYSTVDEVKVKYNTTTTQHQEHQQDLPLKDKKDVVPNNNRRLSAPDTNREVLQEIKFNKKPSGVASRVAQWEHRLMEERSTQIFQTLQKRKLELAHEAEKAGQKQEELWLEQERRAKEAEQQIREIARRAREEHRRTSVLMDTNTSTSPPPSTSPDHSRLQPSPPKSPTEHPNNNYSNSSPERADPRPPNKEAIYEWFRKTEVSRRAGVDPSTNQTAPWFHGLISRPEAECLLKQEQVGSFLVRVSEKIWGYAISLKEEGRCKHYLVEASNGHYQFPGNNQITHKSLADLVSYHSWEPITAAGGELLRKPCPWNQPPDILNLSLTNHKM